MTRLLTLLPSPKTASGIGGDGVILAPMPGRVVAVEVSAGDPVEAGQKVVVIEAMKMEQALLAPFAGIVGALPATTGSFVPEGTLLARITPPPQG